MKLKRCFKKVLNYFNGDIEKTLLWFGTKLPALGEQAPLAMIAFGKTDKLCQFIEASLKQ
jgi:hypothetical protein